MNNLIPDSISAFEKFLTDLKIDDKNNGNKDELVNFIFLVTGPIGKFNLNTSLKSFERSFYFEKPSEDYLVIGLDEAYKISENGETRFVATEKKMNELKSNVISNWESSKPLNIPLFVGAMKFQPERSEDIWTEFDDSTWFIPEVMFFRTNQKNFLVFNVSFSSTTHIEKIKERIKKKLESLFDQTEKEVLQAKIKSISGNSPKEKKKWKGFVTHALENILENNIDKVVLSRRIELLLNNEPNLDYLAESLRTSYPRCSIFCYHHGKSNFFGASPERLALFSAGRMMIEVLAGSAPRGKDEIEDLSIEKNVLMSEKNIREHNFVVEYIKNVLTPITVNINIENPLAAKKLPNIQHISTSFRVTLKKDESLFSTLKELFPTPAVCGVPKENAIHLIKKLEEQKRGLYSGIIGWFNLLGEAEFVISLRSALQINHTLYAYAGSGIVQDSEPEDEFKETELKFHTIVSLFNNENKS